MQFRTRVVDSPAGATRLYIRRIERRLTQEALASRVHASQAQISRIERGELWPHHSLIGRLAEEFGVEFGEACTWVRDACLAAEAAEPQEASA